MEKIIDENAVPSNRKTVARREDKFLSLLPVSHVLRSKVLKCLVNNFNVETVLDDDQKEDDNVKNQHCASSVMDFLEKMIEKYNMAPSKFLLPVLS